MQQHTTTAKLALHPKPATAASTPTSPIPEEPESTRDVPLSNLRYGQSPTTSDNTTYDDVSSAEDVSSTPGTEYQSSDESLDEKSKQSEARRKRRRASTILVSEDSPDARKFLQLTGSGVQVIQQTCCGGGCCKVRGLNRKDTTALQIDVPDNVAFRSLNIKLSELDVDSELTDIVEPPDKTMSLEKVPESSTSKPEFHTSIHPPSFVQPHPPYDVYSAPLWHAKELTKPGAEKRTFHFDLDVTDYPEESGDVDFVVGGAIGVCAPNHPDTVEMVLDALAVPRFLRDKPVLLKTTSGRWPTIWGDEQARELVTTRRDLLTWCTDLQSYPPTKAYFRLLAEYAEDEVERKILMYLSSAEGQGAFCDLRTGPYVTVLQTLAAFPSTRPPLDHFLSSLRQLMPRFYSLSQDPQISHYHDGSENRRLVEVAVTIHESDDFSGTKRTGVGSGFLERMALKYIQAEKDGIDPKTLNIRVPMFRGLMANPLAREFVSDGPMLLIGAGVGVAPFRGFVHRRLKSANCANKVWVLQGIRDSLVDELYSGDWGVHEEKVKKVVQSRRSTGSRYVQDEVRNQAELVWFVINAVDGRVFVCGSSKGMGEGVEKALIDVSMQRGGLNEEEARAFWDSKKAGGQYIAETW